MRGSRLNQIEADAGIEVMRESGIEVEAAIKADAAIKVDAGIDAESAI